MLVCCEAEEEEETVLLVVIYINEKKWTMVRVNWGRSEGAINIRRHFPIYI